MRNIKILTFIAASIASFSVTTSATAALALPSGWYAEGNAGTAKSHISTTGAQTASNSGFGWSMDAGYKFMPFFAAEVGYTKYANSNIKLSGVKIATDSFYSYEIAGKGILPISDTGLELFAKLGAARTNSRIVNTNTAVATVSPSGNSSSTSAYYAVGAQFSFMPNIAVNGQWARAKGKTSTTGSLDLYSVGLSYLFS